MEQDDITAIETNKPAKELIWPGQRLRQAREALNLNLQDVAQQLHLNVNLIQALEDHNEEALPAKTYLIGYLRSYARLLNLPAGSIIEAAQLEPQPTTTLLPENIDFRPQRRIEPVFRLVLIGMLVILCLAAGWWFVILEPEWLPQWLHMAVAGNNPPSMTV